MDYYITFCIVITTFTIKEVIFPAKKISREHFNVNLPTLANVVFWIVVTTILMLTAPIIMLSLFKVEREELIANVVKTITQNHTHE